MSSNFWAIDAAKRKKSRAFFPGSSRFMANELRSGVQATSDAVGHFQKHGDLLLSQLDVLSGHAARADFSSLSHSLASFLDTQLLADDTVDSSRPTSFRSQTPESHASSWLKQENIETILSLAQAMKTKQELPEPELQPEAQAENASPEQPDVPETVQPEPEEAQTDIPQSTEKVPEAETAPGPSPAPEPEAFEQNLEQSPEQSPENPAPAPAPSQTRRLLPFLQKSAVSPPPFEIHNDNPLSPESESASPQIKKESLSRLLHESLNTSTPQKHLQPIEQADREHRESVPALFRALHQSPKESAEPAPQPTVSPQEPRSTEENHVNFDPNAFSGPALSNRSSANPISVKQEYSNDEISDTSFQAISSAIRKSFAGKLSTGNLQGQAPLQSTPRKDTSSFGRGPSTSIKKEPDLARRSILNSASRTTNGNRLSKRTSVFVSLPSREPITFLSTKRQSLRVKSEEHGNVEAANGSLAKSKIPIMHPKPAGEQPREEQSSKEHHALNNLNVRLQPEPKQKEEPSPARSPAKNSSPLHSASMRSRPTLAANKASQLGSPRRERVTKPTLTARSPERTSRRGRSPEKSPIRARLPLRRSPVKDAMTPSRVPQLSSARSTRSPTKYSPAAERDSLRGSPTNYSALGTTPKSPGKDTVSRVSAPTTSSAAKSATKPREKSVKNKFLTTTLNPEKPPLFNPVKTTQLTNPSPIKRLLQPDKEQERIELRGRRIKQSEAEKAEMAQARKKQLEAQRASRAAIKSESPKKRAMSRSPTKAPPVKKHTPAPSEPHVATRRRAAGNALPLPEAARGKFIRDWLKQDKEKSELRTPDKRRHKAGTSGSPQVTADALPDIPSDDESLRKNKYFKSWAETPELHKIIKANEHLDPADVFGDVGELRMDEVFRNTEPRNR